MSWGERFVGCTNNTFILAHWRWGVFRSFGCRGFYQWRSTFLASLIKYSWILSSLWAACNKTQKRCWLTPFTLSFFLSFLWLEKGEYFLAKWKWWRRDHSVFELQNPLFVFLYIKSISTAPFLGHLTLIVKLDQCCSLVFELHSWENVSANAQNNGAGIFMETTIVISGKTLHGNPPYWSLHIYAHFFDLDLISRSQEHQTELIFTFLHIASHSLWASSSSASVCLLHTWTRLHAY